MTRNSSMLTRHIRKALSDSYGDDKKVIRVRIGRVENDRVYGFLKVKNEAMQENFLLDFQATATLQGTVLSLEVNGEKIAG